MMRTLLLKIDNKIHLSEAFSYGVIGTLSAAFSFLAFAFFWKELQLPYQLAVTIAYILTIIFNFCANRHFTFKSSGEYLSRHLYRYLTMILFNYILTMLIFHVIVEWLSLSAYVGSLTSIAVTAVTGFTISKFWIYDMPNHSKG